MIKRLQLILATGFGSGYSPVASGTAGSVVGIGLFLLCWLAGGVWGVVAGTLAFTLLGFWSSGIAEKHYGGRDPGRVVIDEIAGQFVTLLFLPMGVKTLVIGFLLFRLLDIVKPYPARRLEAWPGGAGIMTDDLVAGVYGNLLLQLLDWQVPGFLGALG